MLKYEMRRAFGKFFWIAFLVGVVSGSGGFVSYLLDSEYLPGPGVKFCVSDFRQSQEWRWKAGRILA